jgi:hypothetical protein
MFGQIGRPLAKCLSSGQSSVLLTFGVTNSGKSHTVIGKGTTEDAGLIPRLFRELTSSVEKDDQQLSFSCLEVYNDRYFDLLKASNMKCDASSMSNVEDVVVSGSGGRKRRRSGRRVSIAAPPAPQTQKSTSVLPADISYVTIETATQGNDVVNTVKCRSFRFLVPV